MGAIGIRIAGITGERRFFHWESGEEIKDALSKVVDGEDIIVVSDGGYGIYREGCTPARDTCPFMESGGEPLQCMSGTGMHATQ